MRKFKYMNKKKFSKGDKKFNTKSATKRICYNYAKHGHFIANCPFERRDDDDDKKDKGYKRVISLTEEVLCQSSHWSRMRF
jgi:hypothetical protein